MTLIFLFFSPILFVIFLIIRFKLCISQRKNLVQTYKMDPKKLQKLTCKKIKFLKQEIQNMLDQSDTIGLEKIVRHYRA